MNTPESVVMVAVAENQGEADVWQAFLRAEGIPTLVKNRNPLAYLQAVIPFVPYDHELYVPRWASGHARRLLEPSIRSRKSPRIHPMTRRLAVLWLLLGPGQAVIAMVLWPARFIVEVLS